MMNNKKIKIIYIIYLLIDNINNDYPSALQLLFVEIQLSVIIIRYIQSSFFFFTKLIIISFWFFFLL